MNKICPCFLRRVFGAPKHLFEILVFNRHKKALLDEYAASEEEVMGTLIRQDTTAARECLGHNHDGKSFYCYEDPYFGSTVIRPAVHLGGDFVSDTVQLKLLQDYPKSGYPKFLVDRREHDYSSREVYLQLVAYAPLTLLLSILLGAIGNALLINEFYPLCVDDLEFGDACRHPFWEFLFGFAFVLVLGFFSAKKAFFSWKYQMLEKEIGGYAARDLLRHLPEGSSHKPNRYDAPQQDDEKEHEHASTAPLIARV